MTLTKPELADILVDKVAGMNKNDAKDIVELFFEEIRQALEGGEEVKISGLATSNYVTNHSAPVVTLKPAKKYPSAPVALSLSTQAKN